MRFLVAKVSSVISNPGGTANVRSPVKSPELKVTGLHGECPPKAMKPKSWEKGEKDRFGEGATDELKKAISSIVQREAADVLE